MQETWLDHHYSDKRNVYFDHILFHLDPYLNSQALSVLHFIFGDWTSSRTFNHHCIIKHNPFEKNLIQKVSRFNLKCPQLSLIFCSMIMFNDVKRNETSLSTLLHQLTMQVVLRNLIFLFNVSLVATNYHSGQKAEIVNYSD